MPSPYIPEREQIQDRKANRRSICNNPVYTNTPM